MSTPTVAGHDLRLSRRGLLLGSLICNVELALVVAYFAFTNAALVSPLFTLYGLVWVNVALAVFARYDPPAVDAGTRARAAAVAVGYAAVLAYVGGVVGPATEVTPAGVGVALLPPGWGPALTYGGSVVAAVFMPAKVLGYAALAYLLYGAVAEASGTGVAGVLGLFSCVSCSFPVVAGAAAALFGGGGAVAAAAAGLGYGASTAVFLVTVTLLWRRPGFGALASLRGSRA